VDLGVAWLLADQTVEDLVEQPVEVSARWTPGAVLNRRAVMAKS
jgi:hypothetical protein